MGAGRTERPTEKVFYVSGTRNCIDADSYSVTVHSHSISNSTEMTLQETNPFRRASMLQGTSFQSYGIADTTRITVCRPISPAPKYTPRAPESHIVVRPDFVAQMPALENEQERIAHFAMGPAPPAYPATCLTAKNSPPVYGDATIDTSKIRPAVGNPSIYENIRHVQEATETKRKQIDETNRLRRKLRRAAGIWSCFRRCVPKDKTTDKSNGMGRSFVWAVLAIFLIIITPVIIIKIVIQKNYQPKTSGQGRQQVQMLELPGFPPIPTGVSLVQPATAPKELRTCVSPPELWSCDLPPPATNSIPEFRFEIRYRPADRQRDGPESIWAPVPAPVPSPKDYEETSVKDSSNTTSAGIATEFVISMFYSDNAPNQTESQSSNSVIKRSQSAEIEGNRAVVRKKDILRRQSISDPAQNPPSPLPKILRNQPLRLMDKGLPSEHYAAHMYFQKSIYLDSINMSSTPPSHNNEVPGASDSAKYACIWSFTRFKMQIFTRKSQDLILVDREKNRFQIDPEFGSSMINTKEPIMPYHVTISEDRIGGSENADGKTIACYEILDNENGEGKKLGRRYSWPERKDRGSLAPNPKGKWKAGCSCEWTNWKNKTNFDKQK